MVNDEKSSEVQETNLQTWNYYQQLTFLTIFFLIRDKDMHTNIMISAIF